MCSNFVKIVEYYAGGLVVYWIYLNTAIVMHFWYLCDIFILSILYDTWYDMIYDMVWYDQGYDHDPHAVWETWPTGSEASVNIVNKVRGPCFAHSMGDYDKILL